MKKKILLGENGLVEIKIQTRTFVIKSLGVIKISRMTNPSKLPLPNQT